jgi:Family of unknown function (DUF5995)
LSNAVERGGRTGSIDDVIRELQSIEDDLGGRYSRRTPGLAPADGVASFNGLYLMTTLAVRDKLESGGFEEPGFIERADVLFADYYFAALKAAASGNEIPEAWKPLFKRRDKVTTVHPLQFAFVGMNAHINHDLAFAVIQTCDEQGRTPREDSPEHRDFTSINRLLRDVEEKVDQDFSDGVVGRADLVLGRTDELAIMWKIANARELAWDVARFLWPRRDDPAVFRGVEELIGELVGFAGYGLTLPLGLVTRRHGR